MLQKCVSYSYKGGTGTTDNCIPCAATAEALSAEELAAGRQGPAEFEVPAVGVLGVAGAGVVVVVQGVVVARGVHTVFAGAECGVATIEVAVSGVEDDFSHVLEEVKGLGGLDGGLRGRTGGECPENREEEQKSAESNHFGNDDECLSFQNFRRRALMVK